jgi:hypothetical protein
LNGLGAAFAAACLGPWAAAQPSPAPATGPEDDPAKAARRLLDELRSLPARTAVPDTPLPAPKAGPAGKTRLGEPAAGARAPVQDGRLIVARAAMARRIDGVVHLTVGGRLLPVLPARLLEELDAGMAGASACGCRVTAEITTFRGRNFAHLLELEVLSPQEMGSAVGEAFRAEIGRFREVLRIAAHDRILGPPPGAASALARALTASAADSPPQPAPDRPAAAVSSILESGTVAVYSGRPGVGAPAGRPGSVGGAAAARREASVAELLGLRLPSTAATLLGAEGTVVLNRSGRLVRAGGGYLFHFDAGGPPVPVLPSRELEQAERLTQEAAGPVRLRIAGMLTTYNARSRLRLASVVREFYDDSERN